MPEKILKFKDVAEYLGVSRQTLYNMLSDGRFPVPPVPNSRPRRWLQSAVDAWMLQNVGDSWSQGARKE